MAIPVTIPKATLSMEEATILKWLKREGEDVREGDALLELDTDKAVTEVPAPATGTLERIAVHDGTAAVGAIVGWIAAAPGGPSL